MKVADLMTREVITVSPNMSVKDAAKLLFSLKISGLPVADEEKRVIGMITEKDIIGIALPKFVDQVGELAYLLDTEDFARKIAQANKISVREIMRKEVVCVTEDTPVPEVAKLMIVKKVRRLPVLKNGKLSGIIARSDIVKEISRRAGLV